MFTLDENNMLKNKSEYESNFELFTVNSINNKLILIIYKNNIEDYDHLLRKYYIKLNYNSYTGTELIKHINEQIDNVYGFNVSYNNNIFTIERNDSIYIQPHNLTLDINFKNNSIHNISVNQNNTGLYFNNNDILNYKFSKILTTSRNDNGLDSEIIASV